mgnify:CR=1 FL=1
MTVGFFLYKLLGSLVVPPGLFVLAALLLAQDHEVYVIEGRPDVLAHNVETVPRLYARVRQGAAYERSLFLLRRVKALDGSLRTKSGIMLGLGEAVEEVETVLADLAAVRCDLLTLGQYLAPSPFHAPVERYAGPEEFETWRVKAEEMGFRSVAAAPLVRSSYKAPLFLEALA